MKPSLSPSPRPSKPSIKRRSVVTLKGPKGNSINVKTSDQMEGFGRLKVAIRFGNLLRGFVLEMRKPGTPPSSSAPVTSLTRKDRKSLDRKEEGTDGHGHGSGYRRRGTLGHGQGARRTRPDFACRRPEAAPERESW